MRNPEFVLNELLAHDAWVRSLATHLAADLHDGEDIVQDAWVAALENPPSRIRSGRSWLGSVVRNLARLRRRSAEHRDRRERLSAKPERLPSVSEIMDEEAMRRTLVNAAFSLEEPCRSAILCRYFKDLPPREIARLSGASLAAVEKRIARGLGKLRARLDREFGDRRSWCTALLPLIEKATTGAGAATGASCASLLTGALAVSTKIKIGIVAAVVAVTALVTWSSRPKPPANPPPGKAVEAVTPPVAGVDPVETRGAPPPAGSAPAASDAEQPSQEEATDHVGRSASLWGTVRDPAGAPITDAVVRALRMRRFRSLEMAEVLATRTDQSGSFVLGPLTAKVMVEASAKAHHAERKPGWPGMRIEFVLGKPGVLKGRVSCARDARPCRNARVAVYRWKPLSRHVRDFRYTKAIWSPDACVRTDSEGCYRFPNLKPGCYRTRIFPADLPSPHTDNLEIAVTENRTTERDFVVPEGVRVRGRVLDRETGLPIPRACLSEYDSDRRVFTDERGAYELMLSPTPKINVEAEGYMSVHLAQPSFHGDDVRLDFRLARQANVGGRVIGPNGGGVPRARVGWDFENVVTSDNEAEIVLTDEDGRFLLPFKRRGRIHAVKEGLAWGESRLLSLTPGQSLEHVIIQLGRGGRVIGTVRKPGGLPLIGGEINLKTLTAYGHWWTRRTLVTDEAGRFRFEHLPVGKYEIEALSRALVDSLDSGLAPGVATLEIREGAEVKLDLIVRQGPSLTGRVVDSFDRPLAGVSVSAIPFRRLGKNRVAHVGHPARVTFTDLAGVFRIQGLLGGDRVYRVSAHRDGYRVLERPRNTHSAKAGTGGLDFKLEKLIPLAGHVVHGTSGRPALEFRVTSRLSAPERKRTGLAGIECNHPDGWFELMTSPGTQRVRATTRDGRVSKPVTITVFENVAPPSVTLRLEEGERISGVVTTPQGRPATEARIHVRHRPAGAGRLNPGATSTADAEGRFRIRSVQPGDYVVKATDPRHPEWFAAETLKVERGAESRVNLAFTAGAAVRIRVTDTHRRPVAGAKVVIADATGKSLSAMDQRFDQEFFDYMKTSGATPVAFYRKFERTDAAGTVHPWRVAAGVYRISVYSPNHENATHQIAADSGRTIELDMRLKPAN